MDDASLAAAAHQLAAQGITEAELKRMLAENRNTPTPPAAPAPSAEPVTDPASPEGRTAAALEAAARAEERSKLAQAARLLIQEETGIDVSEWDEQAVLEQAGIVQTPAQAAASAKAEREATLLNDPAAYAAHLREEERAEYRTRFWQLAPSQRVEEAERLGIDLATFQPPRTHGGLT